MVTKNERPKAPGMEVSNTDELADWLRERRIVEVECLVPDMNGMMRGKIVPREEFIATLDDDGLRVAETALLLSVTGEADYYSRTASEIDSDMVLKPDPTTVRVVPWYDEPTAQIICDAIDKTGDLIPFAPRTVLHKVLAAYEARGLMPIVAPELEFYLVERNTDPDYPLTVPSGISGRREAGRQAYGIEAANEYDPAVNRIYSYCEQTGIMVGTMAHEAGPAQLEINFRHGNPMSLADQVFIFKRVVRKAALKENMYATFMAQPHEVEPGSAMHIHQSVLRRDTGENIFAFENGEDSPLLGHYIAGLQVYAAQAAALFCPNVNSFRRMRTESDAPINLHWGRDNRTCGLRIPDSPPAARRVENRVGGADANPYLAFAATLACGLLGMVQELSPDASVSSDAKELSYGLPRYLPDALETLDGCHEIRALLGDRFVNAFLEVKTLEIEEYNKVISSWEREFLLLSV
jgi:glutamine synthetase